jgi:tRNA/rRNA methyltransferase
VIKAAALKNIRVVLTQPSHPGNIGATARAMKTMGLDALYLVNPRRFPHTDADARAAGALDVLRNARVCASLDAALSDCTVAVATSARRREMRHDSVPAREAAGVLLVAAAAQPVALVFGNETSGLSGAEARLCNLWAHVPADAENSSLNLAAAVQIFAYELRLAAAGDVSGAAPEFAPATIEQVEQLIRHCEHTMTATGFLDPANPKRLLVRLRRLLARARLESDEVNILRGFLNAVDKRLPK